MDILAIRQVFAVLTIIRNKWASSFLIVLLFMTIGCSGGVHITEKPTGAKKISYIPWTKDQIKPLGVIKNIRLEIGGIERTPSQEFLMKIRGKLRETNLFHEVLFDKPLLSIPHVELALIIKQSQINGPSFFTFLLGLFSLGLIPFDEDYSAEALLTVYRSDGVQKEYSANGAGNATTHVFGAQSQNTARQRLNDLYSSVNSGNLNSLMSQIVQDSNFFQLQEETPVTKPPI